MPAPLLPSLPDSAEATIEFLLAHGALERGHFILASGRHSAFYVKKGLLVQHAALVQELIGHRRAELDALGEVDVVLSAAVGGIAPGQQLALDRGVRHIYAERDTDNQLVLKRGFALQPGERVLLIEDVTTTGGTFEELNHFVEEAGAVCLGSFVLVNRAGVDSLFGKPLVSCLKVQFPTYPADELPPELAALPAQRPGTKKVS